MLPGALEQLNSQTSANPVTQRACSCSVQVTLTVLYFMNIYKKTYLDSESESGLSNSGF